MIQWVVENIRPTRPHRFIFICLEEHLKDYPQLKVVFSELCAQFEIVVVREVTEGAACTVLLAEEFIDNEEPLMLANSDQFVDCDINAYLSLMDAQPVDGLIMTFNSNHPKWSYCRMRADRTVAEVVEKQVVSNEATVGIYNYRRGLDFVRSAKEMISRNLRVRGEFYVAPAYNIMISRGAKVTVSNIDDRGQAMYGLGTPEDLRVFCEKRGYSMPLPERNMS